MRKWCSRLVIILLIGAYGFMAICYFTGLNEKIVQTQESSLLSKTLLVAFSFLFPLSLFGSWGLMLYDWRKREFKTRSLRRLWLIFMILGMMIGVLFYYVMVFEMGMSLKQDENRRNRVRVPG